MIFMGIRVREAAEAFMRYKGSAAFSDLSQAIDKQTRFFFIQFIFIIIGITIFVLYIVFLVVFLIYGYDAKNGDVILS